MGSGTQPRGPAARKLPGGHHKLSREFVARSQRDRLLDAMAQVCASDGYGAANVAVVIARAGVSRKTFYEHFSDKEDCFLAAYDRVLARFLRQVIGAYDQPALGWRERIRAGLAALLEFLAAEPDHARMCMVEVVGAGPRALERYMSAVRLIASMVDDGRSENPDQDGLPESTAIAVVHGGALVIRDQILAGRAAQLEDLFGELLYSTLVPYVGQDEALAEARRPRAEGRP